MSLRKIIHDAIANQLSRKDNNTPVHDLEWIDVWKGQVGAKDAKEKQYPFNFPAAFISTRRIVWEDMTLDTKEGNVIIDVYIFFNRYGDTFEGATDKDESFTDIDTVDAIADDLHWIEDSPFKELTQIAEEDMTERYERPAFKLSFKTIVYKQVNQ